MTKMVLQVTSHVSRDLLQSAQLFHTDHAVVWEYVANGLEYVDPGVMPTVHVTIDSRGKTVQIRDNGRGMSFADLERYFQMHGENADRKRGKPGRGKFGTGKSAALGIAETLRIATVRNKKRSKVELTRRAIAEYGDERSVPVTVLEQEVPVDAPNGTVVQIEGILLRKIDIPAIVHHVERHIAHWPNASVFVNNQECRMSEPPIAEECIFSTANTAFEQSIGIAELRIKVAKAPLEDELQGIAITSEGVWHETTLVGLDRKPFANYLFGEVSVPALSADTSPISAFDMSRSMRLNPQNPLVGQIYAFVGSKLEEVRRKLEEADRKRRKDAENKRLEQEADEIAKLINQDFSNWRDQIRKSMAKAQGGTDQLLSGATATSDETDIIFGGDAPAEVTGELGDPGHGNGIGGTGGDIPEAAPTVKKPESISDATGTRVDKAMSRKRNSGGFRVDFLRMGQSEARAKYERTERTIFVNLEHPQIAAAYAIGGIDDPAFRRLSYEVAFSEYSIALASEMAASNHYSDVTDPIFDIRSTLDRLARTAGFLYGT